MRLQCQQLPELGAHHTRWTLPKPHKLSRIAALLSIAAVSAIAAPISTASAAQGIPDIRMHEANQVPACVTPDRLMSFLKRRNRNLIPKFSSIAKWYQLHGDRWQVRWDYAFFQMAVETNFLTYRTGRGRMGDVDPAQNNFAGLGTTGGGVPGDTFPDVSSGVLGQIQHLVAYSGERLHDPVAPRTRLKQDHIIALSQKLGRPMTFADLSRRWAVDPNYGRSIKWVADQYQKLHCRGRQAGTRPLRSTQKTDDPVPLGKPTRAKAPSKVVRTIRRRGQVNTPKVAENSGKTPNNRPLNEITINRGLNFGQTALLSAQDRPKQPAAQKILTPPNRLGTQPANCSIEAASYGGPKTLLLRSASAVGLRLTALSVLAGFEDSMVRNFQKSHAPGSEVIGTFDNSDKAVRQARVICQSVNPAGPQLVHNGQSQ